MGTFDSFSSGALARGELWPYHTFLVQFEAAAAPNTWEEVDMVKAFLELIKPSYSHYIVNTNMAFYEEIIARDAKLAFSAVFQPDEPGTRFSRFDDSWIRKTYDSGRLFDSQPNWAETFRVYEVPDAPFEFAEEYDRFLKTFDDLSTRVFDDNKTFDYGVQNDVLEISMLEASLDDYPMITSIDINPANRGDVVTVSGENFGDFVNGRLIFGFDQNVTVTVWDDEYIVFTVQETHRSSYITVVSDGKHSNSVLLTVQSDGPVITSVNPDADIPVGTLTYVYGENFGQSQFTSTLLINGVQMSIETWSDEVISLIMPPEATSGDVVVTVLGNSSNAYPITILVPAPRIDAITPNPAEWDQVVVITGQYFDTSGTLTIGGNAITTSSWADNEIQFTALEVMSSGDAVVNSNAQDSNAVPIAIIAPTPVITNATPNPANTPVEVTITGQNFDDDIGTLRLNGIVVPTTFWSDIEVKFNTSNDTDSGNLVITANNVNSNAYALTIIPETRNVFYVSGNPEGGQITTISHLPYGSAQRTVMLWAKPDGIPLLYQYAVAYGTPEAKKWFAIGADGGALLFSPYGASGSFRSNNFWEDNVWKHVAVTYDGNTIKVYGQGNYLGSATTAISTTEREFRIHSNAAIPTGEYWDGWVREVAIFDKELDLTEINTYKDSILTGNEANLVGYWPINEGNGTIANDLTVNAAHATLTGGEWQVENV